MLQPWALGRHALSQPASVTCPLHIAAFNDVVSEHEGPCGHDPRKGRAVLSSLFGSRDYVTGQGRVVALQFKRGRLPSSAGLLWFIAGSALRELWRIKATMESWPQQHSQKRASRCRCGWAASKAGSKRGAQRSPLPCGSRHQSMADPIARSPFNLLSSTTGCLGMMWGHQCSQRFQFPSKHPQLQLCIQLNADAFLGTEPAAIA